MRELQSQITVVKELRRAGIFFCAIPNGIFTTKKQARMAKASGLEKGAPDLLIFNAPKFVGIALEMKAPGGRLRPEQKAWLARLKREGWLCLVAWSAEDALEQLCAAGLNVRTF